MEYPLWAYKRIINGTIAKGLNPSSDGIPALGTIAIFEADATLTS